LSEEIPRTIHLTLIPLFQAGGNWSIAMAAIRDISIDVADLFSAHVIIGYPNVNVEFDGQAFRTGPSGDITLSATRGVHNLSVPPVIMIGKTARAVFEQWNVTSTSSTLQLPMSSDLCLLAIYRRQYYLNVTSPLGQISGAGWYDENSTATFRVTPPIVTNQGTHVFIGWLGDLNDPSASARLFVDSPKNVEASWEDIKPAENGVNIPLLQALFVASLTVLLASIVFVVISIRHRRSSPSTGRSSLAA
jgi:hypothetical protein